MSPVLFPFAHRKHLVWVRLCCMLLYRICLHTHGCSWMLLRVILSGIILAHSASLLRIIAWRRSCRTLTTTLSDPRGRSLESAGQLGCTNCTPGLVQTWAFANAVSLIRLLPVSFNAWQVRIGLADTLMGHSFYPSEVFEDVLVQFAQFRQVLDQQVWF